jgi:LPS-assembly protein
MFEDSNLFKVDKFAGWDRVEGGGRANYGVKYTAQFNQGGFVKAVFGQSYSLFGQNSFALAGTTNTGLDSGLDTTASDYVAGVYYQPNSTYTFSSRFRFDQQNYAVKRTELEASARFDRWNVSLLYGDYAAQPDIGFLDRREGLLGAGSVKVTANWMLSGAAQYDLRAGQLSSTSVGVSYLDDCLILGLNYITSYAYGSGAPVLNHTVMLQIGLRTLGGTSVSQGLSGVGGQGSQGGLFN